VAQAQAQRHGEAEVPLVGRDVLRYVTLQFGVERVQPVVGVARRGLVEALQEVACPLGEVGDAPGLALR
jgi:hypothetical protein